jgi:hypothetical protein
MLIYRTETYTVVKKNTKALLVASIETGLEVKAENTKCARISWSECRAKSKHEQSGHKSFKSVTRAKYWEQVQRVKIALMQKLKEADLQECLLPLDPDSSSPRLLSKNLNINIYWPVMSRVCFIRLWNLVANTKGEI